MLRATVTAFWLGSLVLGISCTGMGGSGGPGSLPITGRIYYVDNGSAAASDSNPGTEAKPWKTLNRAGSAKELKPRDAVFIKSGVYRESVKITVSGEPGRPILFTPAPCAKVVIKGSELIKGEWTKITPDQGKETYPGQFSNIWKIKLGEEFFTDPTDPSAFADKSKRNTAQVIVGDTHPLTAIGPGGAFYPDKGWCALEPIGKGLEDVRTGTFFFDPKEQALYVKVSGEPFWFSMEVSVRGNVLQISNCHDLVVRGLEFRHGRGNLAGMGQCRRVILEDCKFALAEMGCLGLSCCKDCIVRRCDISWAGNCGMGLSVTEDCIVEDCAIMFNNYRRFGGGWHDGGMKNIPGSKRMTIRRCEVAYNYSGGLWFDMLNTDCYVLDNVCHHNMGNGIGLEVNFGPNVVAGNLCYANEGDGIFVDSHPPREWMRKIVAGKAGDDNEKKFVPENLTDYVERSDEPVWVVNNTVADNANGITTSDSGGPDGVNGQTTRILQNARVMNNLILRNSQADDPEGKYVDARFWIIRDKNGKRVDFTSHSDYNVFATGSRVMLKPDYHWNSWGKDRTLAEWQTIFNEDLHSRILPVKYEYSLRGFRLLGREGLDCARSLPDEVTKIWKPENKRQVGANRTQWPG